jgi:pyruvate dehydrogenase E2 component (dihydrolipoamide acetyltransferase)
MKQEIKMPEVAEGVMAGTVVEICVAVGDQVAAEQTVLELETDKAVVAIPSPWAGEICAIEVEEGAKVKVGALIMQLEVAAEGGTGSRIETDVTSSPVEQTSVPESVPAPQPVAASTAAVEAARADLTSVRRDDRVAPAAPSVRRQARELGVDIYQVAGSGPGGRISADDVREHVRNSMQHGTGSMVPVTSPGQPTPRPLPDYSRFGEISREPLSKVRELTAAAMSQAWSTIPMVTQYDKARVGEIEAFRKQFNISATPETKLTVTAFMVKVCAAALRAFPHFNSMLDLASRELVCHHFVNIGVAVDTPAGLLVPVIRAADSKGVEKIAVELNELAIRTRERRVTPDELAGGTFTISNLGGIGVGPFSPIVYAPQVAILGISAAELQPVWNGSAFEPQLMLPFCLTYDHRVIDGAAGARFLRWICEGMENPLNLLMKG